MSPKTKAKALAALDGMAQIVKAEMVKREGYVTPVVDEARTGAVCGGRHVCALGALWMGYGVSPRPFNGGWVLPGVFEGPDAEHFEGPDRENFLRRRPALRAAYDALNESAERLARLRNLHRGGFEAAIEDVFEYNVRTVGRVEMLALIASAKRKVQAA